MRNLILVSFLVGLSISCKPPAMCGVGCNTAMGEECVSGVCTTQRFAFLTSGIYQLTSANSADKFCQQEADATTSAVTGKKFMAWIATTQQSPLDRVLARMDRQDDQLDVYSTDGVTKISGPIHAGAQNPNDFADTGHYNFIKLTADGRTYSGGYFVQTGSQSSVEAAKLDGSENCKDWTGNSESQSRIVGARDTSQPTFYGAYNWYKLTLSNNGCPGGIPCTYYGQCSRSQSIYCVQVDK